MLGHFSGLPTALITEGFIRKTGIAGSGNPCHLAALSSDFPSVTSAGANPLNVPKHCPHGYCKPSVGHSLFPLGRVYAVCPAEDKVGVQATPIKEVKPAPLVVKGYQFHWTKLPFLCKQELFGSGSLLIILSLGISDL